MSVTASAFGGGDISRCFGNAAAGFPQEARAAFADREILDAVPASTAALARPSHRGCGVLVGAVAGDGMRAMGLDVFAQILLLRGHHHGGLPSIAEDPENQSNLGKNAF